MVVRKGSLTVKRVMSDSETRLEKFRRKYPGVSESDLKVALIKLPTDQHYLRWVEMYNPFIEELWKVVESYKPILSKELTEINSLTREGFNKFFYKNSSKRIS